MNFAMFDEDIPPTVPSEKELDALEEYRKEAMKAKQERTLQEGLEEIARRQQQELKEKKKHNNSDLNSVVDDIIKDL